MVMKKKIFSAFLIFNIFLFSVNLWAGDIKEAFILDPKTNRKVLVVADEIVVRFKAGVKRETIDEINKEFGVEIRKKLRIKNVYRLKVPPAKTINEMLEKYRKNPNVESAGPNHIRRAFTTDTYFNQQWGIERIQAPEAWNIEKGKESIVIAILDTGVDYDHDDLAENMWTGVGGNYGWDFVNEDPYPDDDHNDPLTGAHSHGTICAGIAAAVTNNSTGIAGVSWKSKIMAVKVLDARGIGIATDVAEGIDYAVANRAKVISMSFGGDPDPEEEARINYAYSEGCLLVAASGNYNQPYVDYPAAYDNVIAVGATNNDDERCDTGDWGPGQGSNYGEELDVVAPGNNILSTVRMDKGAYGSTSGTSMAAPFVSGLAALIWSHNSSLTNSDVTDIITSSADDVGSDGWDEYTGYGRINAGEALATFLEKEIVYKVMNFPNPFRPAQVSETTICFTTREPVTERNIDIYNLGGELVHRAPETEIALKGIDPQNRHVYKYEWDGRNDYGQRVASGIYIYVVNADGSKKTGKLAVIK